MLPQPFYSSKYLSEKYGWDVDEARKIKGVLGSRMTGAGFGGCTVSIVDADAVDEFIEKVGANYEAKIGLKPEFYVSEIGNGGIEIKEF